jgi:L-threonylcarbamoyladenylate synthase
MKVLDAKKIEESKLLKAVVASLLTGQVMVLPTDTITGLSCRADNDQAINKIFALKKREENKPLLVLVSSLHMLKKYCFVNRKQELALKDIWSDNRPSSVLLKHKGLLPNKLTVKSPYLAVRLPKSIFLRKIVRSVGVPLVSTSFNLSGEAPMSTDQALSFSSGGLKPDAVLLNYKVSVSKKSSRLVKLEKDAKMEVLRK